MLGRTVFVRTLGLLAASRALSHSGEVGAVELDEGRLHRINSAAGRCRCSRVTGQSRTPLSCGCSCRQRLWTFVADMHGGEFPASPSPMQDLSSCAARGYGDVLRGALSGARAGSSSSKSSARGRARASSRGRMLGPELPGSAGSRHSSSRRAWINDPCALGPDAARVPSASCRRAGRAPRPHVGWDSRARWPPRPSSNRHTHA